LHGALRILQWSWVTVLRTETVLKHECADAVLVEEPRDLNTFVIYRMHAVGAARADDDGGAVGAVFRGRV
jgi:hypothetical protein